MKIYNQKLGSINSSEELIPEDHFAKTKILYNIAFVIQQLVSYLYVVHLLIDYSFSQQNALVIKIVLSSVFFKKAMFV